VAGIAMARELTIYGRMPAQVSAMQKRLQACGKLLKMIVAGQPISDPCWIS
jgi:hypothetical protein